MSNHHAITKDEAPPAPSPRQQKRAADLARYRQLVTAGLDRDAICDRMGRSRGELESLAKATGMRAHVDRGAGECREAMGVRGYDHGARGGRRA